MRSSLPALLLYAPAFALLVGGVVVLITTPLTTAPPCPCVTGPNGTAECPPCAPGSVLQPLGPLLLVTSTPYAFGAFLVRHSRRAKSTPVLPHEGRV
jgi:hypothetical protein